MGELYCEMELGWPWRRRLFGEVTAWAYRHTILYLLDCNNVLCIWKALPQCSSAFGWYNLIAWSTLMPAIACMPFTPHWVSSARNRLQSTTSSYVLYLYVYCIYLPYTYGICTIQVVWAMADISTQADTVEAPDVSLDGREWKGEGKRWCSGHSWCCQFPHLPRESPCFHTKLSRTNHLHCV